MLCECVESRCIEAWSHGLTTIGRSFDFSQVRLVGYGRNSNENDGVSRVRGPAFVYWHAFVRRVATRSTRHAGERVSRERCAASVG